MSRDPFFYRVRRPLRTRERNFPRKIVKNLRDSAGSVRETPLRSARTDGQAITDTRVSLEIRRKSALRLLHPRIYDVTATKERKRDSHTRRERKRKRERETEREKIERKKRKREREVGKGWREESSTCARASGSLCARVRKCDRRTFHGGMAKLLRAVSQAGWLASVCWLGRFVQRLTAWTRRDKARPTLPPGFCSRLISYPVHRRHPRRCRSRYFAIVVRASPRARHHRHPPRSHLLPRGYAYDVERKRVPTGGAHPFSFRAVARPPPIYPAAEF